MREVTIPDFERLGLDEQKLIAEADRANARLRGVIAARSIDRGKVERFCDLLSYQIDHRSLRVPARVVGVPGYRARMVNKRKRRTVDPVIHDVNQAHEEFLKGLKLGLLHRESASHQADFGHQLVIGSGHLGTPQVVAGTDGNAAPHSSHCLSEIHE
jgi:hypothetical protein